MLIKKWIHSGMATQTGHQRTQKKWEAKILSRHKFVEHDDEARDLGQNDKSTKISVQQKGQNFNQHISKS